MYLRGSKQRNEDGSRRLPGLTQNERRPKTGSPVAKLIHNFGQADKVDMVALARLVASISRILDLPDQTTGVVWSDIEVVGSSRIRGANVPDEL